MELLNYLNLNFVSNVSMNLLIIPSIHSNYKIRCDQTYDDTVNRHISSDPGDI